jgi:hypothetical protein
LGSHARAGQSPVFPKETRTAEKSPQEALQKYQHRSPANFPTYVVDKAWLGADLMIKGLQLAGRNPSRASVIKSLRGIKSSNGNRLAPPSQRTSEGSSSTALPRPYHRRLDLIIGPHKAVPAKRDDLTRSPCDRRWTRDSPAAA